MFLDIVSPGGKSAPRLTGRWSQRRRRAIYRRNIHLWYDPRRRAAQIAENGATPPIVRVPGYITYIYTPRPAILHPRSIRSPYRMILKVLTRQKPDVRNTQGKPVFKNAHIPFYPNRRVRSLRPPPLRSPYRRCYRDTLISPRQNLQGRETYGPPS